MTLIWAVVASVSGLGAGAKTDVPLVVVNRDDTVIVESCRVVIPPGLVIPDSNGDGVIHVGSDGISIQFADGSVLRGADAGTPWDQLTGTGIRIESRAGVTLRGVRVHGFKTGILATRADGLVIDSADLSDNYRQRLRSTPAAEDSSDWLFPHHNDSNEWITQHGAALSIEGSSRVSVLNVRVRRGQNGIVLDRVDDSRVFDNDCSFLSGWGLAMWRSSRNMISRNALDFCVRGYSHGVYNRGQDSAGILCFEQCSGNIFAENSATHGGDGFFGFAGREAIGETPVPRPDFAYERAGCSDNLLIGNDFSYAVAHGIEMTFSHGNRFTGNRLVECGICGVWGGYSGGTIIDGNTFERNGQMAYGLERGGVNIEHGSNNLIVGNRFRENACGVHFWWDDDRDLLAKPGVKANDRGVTGNIVAHNTFSGDGVCLQLRDTGSGHLADNRYVDNAAAGVGTEIQAPPGAQPILEGQVAVPAVPRVDPLGASNPLGARAELAGRQNIIMDGWGPWDHEAPTMRPRGRAGSTVEFELFGLGAWDGVTRTVGILRHGASGNGRDVAFDIVTTPPAHIDVVPGSPTLVRLRGDTGVWSYDAKFRRSSEPEQRWAGTVVGSEWNVACFPWTADTDPREDLAAWRARASEPDAVSTTLNNLSCHFAGKGPRDVKWSDEMSRRGPDADHFGLIASSRITFPRGRWRVNTQSDDGVRVTVNGAPVVERWDWHAPTRDSGDFVSDGSESLVEVEYFEINGYAVLEVAFEPVEEPSPAVPTPPTP